MKALRQTDLYTVVGVRFAPLLCFTVPTLMMKCRNVIRERASRIWTCLTSYTVLMLPHSSSLTHFNFISITSPSHCLQTRDIQLALHGSRDTISLVTSVMRAYLLSLLQGKSPANLTQRFVADRLKQSVRLVTLVCLVRVQIKTIMLKEKTAESSVLLLVNDIFGNIKILNVSNNYKYPSIGYFSTLGLGDRRIL